MPKAELAKCQVELYRLLQSPKLWKSASSSDAFIRRSLYQLLVSLLEHWITELNPTVVSSNVLTSSLNISQVGSANDYTNVLVRLTANLPSVWSQDYQGTGKKSAKNRLCQFLRKGSQGASTGYWASVGEFLELLPISIFSDQTVQPDADGRTKNVESILEVLDALHDGIVHKDEARTNSYVAWQTYLLTCEKLCMLQQEDQKNAFLDSHIYPLVFQYVRPSLENSRWSIFGSQAEDICVKACLTIIKENEDFFVHKLQDLSLKFVEDLRLSLPEHSKDYAKSQDALATRAVYWYCLQRTLWTKITLNALHEAIRINLNVELEAEISLLSNRIGKPYGAAAALEKAVELFHEVVLANDKLKIRLHNFANNDLPRLLFSASSQQLVHILDLLPRICDVTQGFNESIRLLLDAPQSAHTIRALHTLFSSSSIVSNGSVAQLATKTLELALQSNESESWEVLAAAFGNPEAPRDLIDTMLVILIQNLSIEERRDSSLYGIELLSRRNPESLQEYSKSLKGSSLVEKLLFLADSPDESTAQRALVLSNALQTASARGADKVDIYDPSLTIIKRNFEEVTDESLS